MADKLFIKDSTDEELTEWCRQQGIPTFRSRQIREWLWQKNATSFEAMHNLGAGLIQALKAVFNLESLHELRRQVSVDGTEKLLIELPDGALTESVYLPSGQRTTACISSQSGCPLACSFCATGRSGFSRNLKAWEIYDQVVAVNRISLEKAGHKLNNIVVMGMGEPFMNYEALAGALHRLCDAEAGLGFSPQRITVSTAGLPDGIRRFAMDFPRVQLAVSLHSARQAVREKLMPVARTWSLDVLREALQDYHSATEARITFEYVLLDGVNDGPEDARALASFCKSFPVKINLITFNKVTESDFYPPELKKIHTFAQYLSDKNILVQLRKSRGADIDAACGQLAQRNHKELE